MATHGLVEMAGTGDGSFGMIARHGLVSIAVTGNRDFQSRQRRVEMDRLGWQRAMVTVEVLRRWQ